MKKTLILIAAAAMTLVACNKVNTFSRDAVEAYIDATSKTTWTYFSLSDGAVVGTGEENETDNAVWASRTDWDFAVCRYNIRTNSGKSTTTGAKGGVYISSETFETLTRLPDGITFETDELVVSQGMSGTTSVVESTATVILFLTNEDGSKVMPPVYLKAPVYIFRTADGTKCYKVEFFQYQDENKVTGHVKFNFARIS